MRIVLALTFVLLCVGYVVSVESRLASIERIVMQPGYLYHEHWSGSPPVKIVVETRRQEGESVEDWKARHAERVAQALADHPPV